eukprot:SAG31_NODE_824_length_11760_cov_17.390790_1_plen_478_part_00
MGCVASSRHEEEVAAKDTELARLHSELEARRRHIEMDNEACAQTEDHKQREIEHSKQQKTKAEQEWDTLRTLLREVIKAKKAREQTLIQQVVMTLQYREVTVCFREWKDWVRFRKREKFTNTYRQKVEDLAEHNKVLRTQRDFALKKSVLLSNNSLQLKAKAFVAQMGFRSRSVWFDMWKQFVRDSVWDRRNAWSLSARQNIERLESEINRMEQQLLYCEERDSEHNTQIGKLQEAHAHRENMVHVVGEGLLVARHVSERQLAQFPHTAMQNDLHQHRNELNSMLRSQGVERAEADAVADWLTLSDVSRSSASLSTATQRKKGYLDKIGRASRRADKFEEGSPPHKHQWADMAAKRRAEHLLGLSTSGNAKKATTAPSLAFSSSSRDKKMMESIESKENFGGKTEELRLPQILPTLSSGTHPALQHIDDQSQTEPLILRTPRALKPSAPAVRMKPVPGSMARSSKRKLVPHKQMTPT